MPKHEHRVLIISSEIVSCVFDCLMNLISGDVILISSCLLMDRYHIHIQTVWLILVLWPLSLSLSLYVYIHTHVNTGWYGGEAWTLNTRTANRLAVFERKVLRRILVALKINNTWRRRNHSELMNCMRTIYQVKHTEMDRSFE